jgi:alpha-1,2-mannosyltransferase
MAIPAGYKIQSVFARAPMWGAPIALAYAVQGAMSAALAAALIRLWRGVAPYPLKAAALCLAAILAAPYAFDYDMVAVAPAIAFLFVDGLQRGFAPWDKTALAALWLAPILARTVPHLTLIPSACQQCSQLSFSWCGAARRRFPPRRGCPAQFF